MGQCVRRAKPKPTFLLTSSPTLIQYECVFTQPSLGLVLVEDSERGTLQVARPPEGENSTLVEEGDEVEALDGMGLMDHLHITTVEGLVQWLNANPSRPIMVTFKRPLITMTGNLFDEAGEEAEGSNGDELDDILDSALEECDPDTPPSPPQPAPPPTPAAGDSEGARPGLGPKLMSTDIAMDRRREVNDRAVQVVEEGRGNERTEKITLKTGCCLR